MNEIEVIARGLCIRDGKVLLCRHIKQAYNYLPGGHVEFGESATDALAREMMEEAGVAVHNVRYHSTQPWPYPSQLMIGCHCEAETEEITVDGIELDEARWFSRDDLRAVLAGEDKGFWVPPPFAIAHQLIKSWVAEG